MARSLVFEADSTPQFFKIISQDSIRDGKLGIPAKFVRKYGGILPSSTVLKVPSGDKWRVELIKCDGEIWLKNGWQEFAKFYSLAYGSFLVFQYDKKSCHFNVIILDKSATEIEYPYDVSHGDTVQPNGLEKEFQEQKIEVESESEASVDSLDRFLQSQKRKMKSPLSCPQPPKKMKQEKPTRKNKAKKRNGGLFREEHRSVRVIKRLTSEEKYDALRRANTNFKSENPFFSMAMQPSYVYVGSILPIPSHFSKIYFKEEQGKASLNTWSVEYTSTWCNGRKSIRLSNGWREFEKENHLEVGDVCFFELIEPTEMTFKVTIFRHAEGSKQQSVGEKSASREKFIRNSSSSNLPVTIESTEEFSSIYPFFKAVISSSHLDRSNVHLPYNFVSDIHQSKVKARLQVENKWWDVILNIYRRKNRSRGLISAGWRRFSRENFLRVGDFCMFELIDSKPEMVLMNVTIIRNS